MIRDNFKRISHKYEGMYRGVVVDNNDPDKLGRVKLLVRPMFKKEDIPISALPWAVPAFPLHEGSGADSGVQFGYFSIPRLDTEVWVFFEAGDYNQPVFFAEAYNAVKGKPLFADTNYPDRKGIRYQNGVEIYVDESTDEITLNHPSGASVLITGVGDIKATSVNNIEIISAGKIDLTATGDVTIKGANVYINP